MSSPRSSSFRPVGILLRGALLGTLTVCLMPSSGEAQQPDPAEMERMMQQGMQMAECMSKVDPKEMEAVQALGERMEAEVSALCKAGKRDAAMAKAMELGQEMSKAPIMDKMRDCGSRMEELMKGGMVANSADDGQHVCDDL
ncbi:MAG: hypothetical protein RL434_1654 [Pseudomonadota bacterium]